MAINKQFENLFIILDNSEYEINTPFKKVITDAVQKAGFCDSHKPTSLPDPPQNVLKKKGAKGEAAPKKLRKLSGYNLFMKHTMPQLTQDTKIQPKERLGEVAKRWKGLSQNQRDEWNNKAKTQQQPPQPQAQPQPQQPQPQSLVVQKGKNKALKWLTENGTISFGKNYRKCCEIFDVWEGLLFIKPNPKMEEWIFDGYESFTDNPDEVTIFDTFLDNNPPEPYKSISVDEYRKIGSFIGVRQKYIK